MGDDLRAWLAKVEGMEELKKVDGADWNLEISCLNTLNWKRKGPALLFDKIKGYPAGFRVLTSAFVTANRVALTLGLPAGFR
ncbi:MAG: decarboxylase UbiD [Dehalococcoidia bacterium]|nr:decarboxylase UbiD [Dehalococcoidia bacterium]